jgi:hypothetical protein
VTTSSQPGRCPQCRGRERVQISPGFYECRSVRTVGVVPPHGPSNPTGTAWPVHQVCGHRYQEGGQHTGGAVCHCGVFAVGVCQRCGTQICGVHGIHAGGQWVCGRHLEEDRASAEAQRNRALDDLRPKAMGALDRQLAALRGDLERLRALVRATGVGRREERGVEIGHKREVLSYGSGEAKALLSGPGTLLSFLRFQGGEVDLFFADDGRTYALGLGNAQEFPAGMGYTNLPVSELPAALFEAAADEVRQTMERTQSLTMLQDVADLREPPSAPEPVAQPATPPSSGAVEQPSRSRKRRWFGLNR